MLSAFTALLKNIWLSMESMLRLGLHWIRVPIPKPCWGHPGSAPLKRQAELFFPPEFADDFPVAMQISERYGLVYVVTKLGLLVRGEGFLPRLAEGPTWGKLALRAASEWPPTSSVTQNCGSCHSFLRPHKLMGIVGK